MGKANRRSKGIDKPNAVNGELTPRSPPGLPQVSQERSAPPEIDPDVQLEAILRYSQGLFRSREELERFVAFINEERRRSRGT